MKRTRTLPAFLVCILLVFPLFFAAGNQEAYAASEVTVSNYTGLKSALSDQSNTLIKLNPGTYDMDGNLTIDHKVRLVGVGDASDVILNGQDHYNITVGVPAMLENITLSRLYEPDPVKSLSSLSAAQIDRIKAAFKAVGADVPANLSEWDWDELLDSVPDEAKEDFGDRIMALKVEIGVSAAVIINGGTIQNCRIVNNLSASGMIVLMKDGTLFNSLVAFNTTENTPAFSGYSSLMVMTGHAYAINNTLAYNDYDRGESRNRLDDGIGIYGPCFVLNNVVYKSAEYSIYNYSNTPELLTNNAADGYISDIGGENIQLLEPPFVNAPDLDVADGEMGYQGDEALPEFDLSPASGSKLTGKGLDVFFDIIPKDMDGTSRLLGGHVDVGAYQCKTGSMPEYAAGDVLYVSKVGNDSNSGLSWNQAMASPEQAVINAARGGIKDVLIAKGEYEIKGRVMLYIQKDGFSGGIWTGIVLADGLSLSGGFNGNETGSVTAQKDKRNQSESPWDFGASNTILKGSPSSFDPDYLNLWGLRGGEKEKPYTKITNGVRVITQVEDFDAETTVDGLQIKNGYTICGSSTKSSYPHVKKVNKIGGAGILTRKNCIILNTKIDNCYEATLYLPNQLGNDVCGGGAMNVGGTYTGCCISNNISETCGGGLFLYYGLLENSVVENNFAFDIGGGIVTAHGNTLESAGIKGCTIKGNHALGIYPPSTDIYGIPSDPDPLSALGLGGGIWMANNVTVDSTIFESNTSKNGGDAIYLATKGSEKPQGIVRNSLIRNHKENSAVIMEQGLLLHSNIIGNKNPFVITQNAGSGPRVSSSVFWDNETLPAAGINIVYSALTGSYGDSSAKNITISENNNAATGPNFTNPVAGNYHLLTASPLIDKAGPLEVEWDFDGTVRPQGSLPDIGMFEAQVKIDPDDGKDKDKDDGKDNDKDNNKNDGTDKTDSEKDDSKAGSNPSTGDDWSFMILLAALLAAMGIFVYSYYNRKMGI